MNLIRTYRTQITRIGLVVIAMFIALFGVWKFYELKSHRKAVQQQILEGIPDSKLTYFEFSPSELANLKWEHSKEFTFKSEKFDLVRSQYENGIFKLWCWKDVKESQMDKNLNNLVFRFLGTNPSKNTEKKVLTDFFKSFFFEDMDNVAHISNIEFASILSTYNRAIKIIYFDVPHGPPEII